MLAALVVPGFAQQAATVNAGGSRPVLKFKKAKSQSTLGRAYDAALHNLLDINTVPYEAEPYNQTGFLSGPPGTFIRAGGGYAQPWTRDASVNSWNAASLLEPEAARNTLWSVVRRRAGGKLEIQQDKEWWDQAIWVVAAWNHYLVTGDRNFLAAAYETSVDSLAILKAAHFNAIEGLFEGPGFFNDGIAGYPVPPATESEDLGSFVLDYPRADKLMVLSTNCIYAQAYRSAALMAAELGKSAADAAVFTAMADALKQRINQRFWIPGKGIYGYLLRPDAHGVTLDESEEAAGLSFAILFDIAGSEREWSIHHRVHVQPHGIVDVYPHFPRYNDARPGRHNQMVWPMVEGLWALTEPGGPDFSREVSNLASLALASGGDFYEIYNAQTGAVDGGWQSGKAWKSESDQTWSATAFLSMIYRGMFGMKFATEGLHLWPTLPRAWGEVSLNGLRYRNMVLNIRLHGHGPVIRHVKLDGVRRWQRDFFIPSGLSGTHSVDITLGRVLPM